MALVIGLAGGVALSRRRPVRLATAPAVAVSVATVTRASVPVAVSELGAAQPWQAVTIRTQVNGRLQRVVVQEGSDVKAGDLIAQIDPAPYRALLIQAQGALRRDQAQLEIARLDLERYRQLATVNSIAQQQVDATDALVKQLEGTVLSDQGAVDSAQVNLDYCTINSPVTGRVGVRLLDAGNLVSTSDTGGIITVNQLAPIAVTFSVPQSDFQRLWDASAGFHRALRAEAFTQDGSVLLGSGVLTVADNHVDAASGTVQLKARFENGERKLWPGQFVNVRVTLKVIANAITMPLAAVNRGPQNTFAYVIGPDQTAQVRPVTVESVQGTTAVIGAGVSPGDTVVVDGQMSLRAGSAVRVVNPPIAIAAADPSGTSGPVPAAPP